MLQEHSIILLFRGVCDPVLILYLFMVRGSWFVSSN